MMSGLSNVIFQPLLMGIAISLMVIALIYQNRASTCNNQTDPWGQEIFNINMGVGATITIASIIVGFVSAL